MFEHNERNESKMKKFMDENFLLSNDVAIELYHNYAKKMPIFDFHCHLSPKEIADNKKFRNITELWLGGDHYKWRALRANGVEEELITGSGDEYEKFKLWAKTVPYCIGNPLYHWSHLELRRFFNIDTIISEATAEEIWNKANELIKSDDFSAKNLIINSNVKALCTTDDPIDTLEHHRRIREDREFDVNVLPTLRPDKGINIQNDTFVPWVQSLSNISNIKIESYEDFLKALESRVQFFHEEGCRISDHGIDKVTFEQARDEEINSIFKKALKGEELTIAEINKYKTRTLIELAKMYSTRGWTMQLHIGAMRNVNSNMFNKLGPDTGYDSIADDNIAEPLAKLLNEIDYKYDLPKTILYNLSPKDNDVLVTLMASFQGGGIPGKMQFGSGWWFLDQKDGMTKQMISLANNGLLSRFVGMVTDSRSFISYPRHEYFRRILCNLIGTWVEEGEYPYDLKILGKIVQDICYGNALDYLGIEV
ncbi:glucuronate isomerase [Serpentinicella alkaliphila]